MLQTRDNPVRVQWPGGRFDCNQVQRLFGVRGNDLSEEVPVKKTRKCAQSKISNLLNYFHL